MAKTPASPTPPPSVPDVLGEGLLSSSTIRLFGRPYEGLTINKIGANPNAVNFLHQALGNLAAAAKSDPSKAPQLARIYGFTYLGNYYRLAVPTVYLVIGDGMDVPSGVDDPDPIPMSQLGVEFKQQDFVQGIKMWIADSLDAAIRIDVTVGYLCDLLIGPEMNADNNVTGGGVPNRADIVGRDGQLVGRDGGQLVGRDGQMIGPTRRR